MAIGDESQSKSSLRNRAEEILARLAAESTPPTDFGKLVHELNVHQIELEMQNEALRQTRHELETSRDRYMQLYDFAPVGYVTIDPTGQIKSANVTFGVLVKLDRVSLLRMRFADLVAPPDQREFYTLLQRCRVPAERPPSVEARLIRRDAVEVWVQLRVEPELDESSQIREYRLTATDISAAKQAEKALQQARDELEERVAERTGELQRRTEELAQMATELTLAEQRERRRLAEVLHDHLQQMLVRSKMDLEIMLHGMTDVQQAESVRRVMGFLAESIDTSRTLTVELAPPVLYQGSLAAALKWLAQWMLETHGLTVELDADPQASTNRDDIKTLIFQAVRELLFNVVKHAGTNRARVQLSCHDADSLKIVVSDRGSGCDPQAILSPSSVRATGGGFGLCSTRQRLGLLGGRMEIHSEPQRGTIITLVVPTHDAHPVAVER